MSLETVLQEVAEWASETFGLSNPASKVAHLRREVEELADDPTNGEEMADCLMILAHLAAGVGVDLELEVARKLALNRARTWAPPDSSVVVEHVRTEAPP